MSETLNVGEAIQKEASDVPLEELAKQGFKRVEVLDRKTINRLIEDAVVRVVAERLAEATERERAQITAEAKAKFQNMLKEQQQHDGESLSRVQGQVSDLETQANQLRADLARKESEIAELQTKTTQEAVSPASAELQALKESIDTLAKRVTSGTLAGTDFDPEATDEKAIQALIQRAGAVSTDLESNLQNVEVKRAQAKSGVNKHLEKLRQLKRGGGE